MEQSSEFLVDTLPTLLVTPRKIQMGLGENQRIRILGGLPPYIVSADGGSLTPVAEGEYLFQAPGVVGDYLIRVQDQQNAFREIKVSIFHDLWVTPKTAYLRKGAQKAFQLMGGVGTPETMILQALKGDVPARPDPDFTFTYTAPAIKGSDSIIITDINGFQQTVSIEVTSDYFFITPGNAALLQGEKRLFRTVGGTGDTFVWTAEKGDLTPSASYTGHIQYQAPKVRGDVALLSIDAEKREATAEIHVISNHVEITPQTVFLSPGGQAVFRALMGAAPYTFAVSEGDLETTGDDRVTYTAPQHVGEFIISVFDAAGHSKKAKAIVSGGVRRLVPSTPTYRLLSAPFEHPDGANQPVAVGNIQNNGSLFELKADFPNYHTQTDTPVPMNYYVALYVDNLHLILFFDAEGHLYTMDTVQPFLREETDAIYTSVFAIDFCAPDFGFPVGEHHVFCIAVPSDQDLSGTLDFLTGNVPFEAWHFTFTFKGCQ